MMSILRILQSIHGHLGALSTIALLHPMILLRNGRPLSFGGKWATLLSTLLIAGTYFIGIGIYPSYRVHVKKELFRINYNAGFLFETKEHIAFGAITLAVGACIAAFAAPHENRDIRKAASIAFGASFFLSLITGIIGVYVSSIRDFP